MARPTSPFVLDKARTSRASAALAVSLLLTTIFGAGQAVVLVAIVGQGERTDAFFAAYSVYLPLVLWAAALRASLVPLVVLTGKADDARRRSHAATVVGRVAGIGALVSVALLAASPVLATALGHGMSSDGRQLLLECIWLLVAAGFLHFCSGALSAVLSGTQRFGFSAFAYSAGSAVAIGTSAVLLLWLGVVGSAIGVLCGAACVALAHGIYARRLGVVVRISVSDAFRRRGRDLWLKVVAGGGLLAAQQAGLAITLSRLSPTRGAITSFTYAFMLINLLVSLSFSPLTLALMPQLVEDVSATGAAAARAQLVRVMSVASYFLLPSLLALVAFADPLLPEVLGGFFTPAGAERLVDMIHVLAIVAIPTAVFFVAGNALHALQRWGQIVWLSFVAVAIHAAIVLPLGGLGPVAVTVGHTAAIVVIAAVVARAAFGSRAWQAVGAALIRIAPAACMALVFILARLSIGDDPPVGLAGAALAAASLAYLYLLLTVRADLRGRLRSVLAERLSR